MIISDILFLLFVITASSIYVYFKSKFSYWKNRKVPYVTPLPFFGNILDIFLLKCNIAEKLAAIYIKSKVPLLGLFFLQKPVILLRDTDLIKEITIKNFEHFQNRSVSNSLDDRNGDASLILAKYETWNIGRKIIGPAFASMKLNKMTNVIEENCEKMVVYLREVIQNNKEVNVKDLFVRYGMENACAIFFGLQAHCFSSDDSPLKRLEKELFDYRVFRRGAHVAMSFIAPEISKVFGFNFIDKDIARYLVGMFQEHFQNRKKNMENRKDYIDLLGEAAEKTECGTNLFGGSAEIFAGGYEPISSSLSFAFYELARNQEIQEKLRQEIHQILYNNMKVINEKIPSMPYLELFNKELNRMYPTVGFIDRICTKNFYLDKPKLLIEKGITVYISVLGIHYDPKYYPEPYKFYPERYLENGIDWSVYLPFGKGPRMCLAKKYTELVVKYCLIYMIKNFEIKLCSKSPNPMRFNTKGFSLQPSGDVYFEIQEIPHT